ncbi:MAG: serine phosphatase RsbU (regulator of sigma subunit) [Crocinitomix sp.]|jgi:serine phosphatase RsbU (regulator of sigma subunit)
MRKLENIFESKLLEELKYLPVHNFKKGEVLIKESEFVEFIPILLNGKIEVTQSSLKKIKTHVYYITPVQCCILSLVSGQKNLPSVGCGTVQEDSSIILVPPSTTKKWFNMYSSWRDFISGLYDHRLSELIHSRNLVQEQANLIKNQKKELTDSISYSKRIQNALLQSEKQFVKNVPHSFILNKPKDIVSGDFFWSKKINNRVLFAVADCTGHGVPGAMVSIVCYQTLEETASNNPDAELGNILNKVREKIQQLFSANDDYLNDGMDISLCSLDSNSNILSYSGANNSIYRVTTLNDQEQYSKNEVINSELKVIEYKADRQAIGKVDNVIEFNTDYIEYLDGDSFYLTSDGFQDQFGGLRNKKLTKRRMKEHFLQNALFPLDKIVANLDVIFNQWKEEEEQVDDVLIVGIKTYCNKT